jgi:hypothetical protein
MYVVCTSGYVNSSDKPILSEQETGGEDGSEEQAGGDISLITERRGEWM